MEVLYIGDVIPNRITKTIYLAGTASNINNWRQKAIKILDILGYNGIVFNPQWKDNTLLIDSEKERKWEEKCIAMSDFVLFYFDRDIENEIYGFEQSDLFGQLKDNKNICLVTNPNADFVDYQLNYVKQYKIPHYTELYNGLKSIIDKLDNIIRLDGERFVPQYIWNTKQFQNWYKKHKSIGNWISDAKVLSAHGNYDNIFMFNLWVNIFIKSENRYKNNEFIISRTDIASCVLYKKENNILETKIIIVSEFRSPVNNDKCIVYELPGGSSNSDVSMEETVLDEIYEETGFKADKDKLKYISSRQLYSTMLTHKSHLYAYELSDIDFHILSMNNNKTFGNNEETEFTTVHIMTLQDILNKDIFDWSTVGQIMSVIKAMN